MKMKAAILARGCFGSSKAKTAHGLIRHSSKFKIKEVVDETLAGKDAGEFLGLGILGIPIVNDFSKDIDSLIIGIAPPGGKLPKKWRSDIKRAIKCHINIVSGMHEFLSDDKELATLAKQYNAKIWDVRKHEGKLELAKGYKHKVPVVLVAGTDSCVGKRTTALELVKSAQKKGLKAGFVATGQTGIMIGCDAGIAVDAIPGDFIPGAVEKMVRKVSQKGKQIIFVEGQGSILHSAYGPVALGILYGSKPECVIMVHNPARKHRNSYPEKVPKLEFEIEAVQKLGNTSVVGISLNCKDVQSWEKVAKEYERKYKLPATDVLKDSKGAEKLLNATISKLNL
ncbi:MAG: DUF1611 domain-containing protein [Candidatus Thermoplasmatota archaeon]|nr:DUF1611 domain-containing protein [Candidatus Thermoplasmatota archaeon]